MVTVQTSTVTAGLFGASTPAEEALRQKNPTDPRLRLKQAIGDETVPGASQPLVKLLRDAVPDLKTSDLSPETASFILMDDPALWQTFLDSQHEAIMQMLDIMARSIAETSRRAKKADAEKHKEKVLRKVVELAVEYEGVERSAVVELLEQYGLGGLAPGSVELQAGRPPADQATAGADATPATTAAALGTQPGTPGIGTRPSTRPKPDGWR